MYKMYKMSEQSVYDNMFDESTVSHKITRYQINRLKLNTKGILIRDINLQRQSNLCSDIQPL